MRTAAAAIVERAKSADAGRVVFKGDEGFVFAEPNTDDVVGGLAESGASRFKLQSIGGDGRWFDVSKYEAVSADDGSLLDALRASDARMAQRLPAASFGNAAASDPRGLLLALRALTAKIAVTPRAESLAPWADFLNDRARGVDFAPARYAASTLTLLRRACSEGLDHALRERRSSTVLSAIDDVADGYRSGVDAVALHMLRGKLLSLDDRAAAAAAFRRAVDLDADDMVESFYSDIGAKTYFTADEVANADVAAVTGGVRWMGRAPAASMAVAVSVDPGFFRIYGPQMVSFAQQLPDVDVVLVLCCDEPEAATLIEDAEVFAESLQRLNRSGPVGNVRYMLAPTPAAVGGEKTWFASARFFAARPLLERYERVYLMDADLTALEDPSAYFGRVARVAFGTPTNVDSTRLSPWRRNLAGNVAVHRGALDGPILADVERYLAHGLTLPSSWMLDQNALTFAAERHPAEFVELDAYKRPFTQLKFRSTWERNYRRQR